MFLISKDKDTILLVKIVPNSKKNYLTILNDRLKINITAPPIDNRANIFLIDYISKNLNIKKNLIQIVQGKKSKLKSLLIKDLSRDDINQKILEVINAQS